MDVNAVLMSIDDQSGCNWLNKAAAPATCGLAILVPVIMLKFSPPSSGEKADKISVPGAARSGLRIFSLPFGPRELD